MSHFLCVFWSFYRNSRYVLRNGRENRKWTEALLRMYLAYQVSWIVLDNVLLCLRISVLWISEYIALVLPLIVCVPVNCVMNRYRAFR